MKWEYHVVKRDVTGFWTQGHVDEEALAAEMNRLGSQGWELVSAFDTNSGHGGSRNVITIFKRPVG